jgi:uncharacterized protein (TIGR02246 family)
MKKHLSITAVASCCLALLVLSCEQRQQPASDTSAADEAAIRAINPAWFKSYNAGDVEGVVALYAEDAVVNAPGSPAVRGQAAIREYLNKYIAATASAGVASNGGPTTDVGVSGDLGWEWGTFTVTNKSGATVDRGKYVTVCAKRDGKWFIIRDIWNSDGPMKAMQ